MDLKLPEEIKLESWEYCTLLQLPKLLHQPKLKIVNDEFNILNEKNQELISKFIEYVCHVSHLVTQSFIYGLFDSQGILLKIFATEKCVIIARKECFIPGVSFTEESCGTNAVALSIKNNKPILVTPEQHYCSFLQNFFEYTHPLQKKQRILGYLNLVSFREPLPPEMIVITNLLTSSIVNSIRLMDINEQSKLLTDQQIEIIKLLCRGFPEKAIATELELSINTIKYHKKKIFQKLNTSCTAETIAKAIKLNIISVNSFC